MDSDDRKHIMSIDGVLTLAGREAVLTNDILAAIIVFANTLRKQHEDGQLTKDEVVRKFSKYVSIYSCTWRGREANPKDYTLAELESILTKVYEDAQSVPPSEDNDVDSVIYRAEMNVFVKWLETLKS